jgi:hypothetical protein
MYSDEQIEEMKKKIIPLMEQGASIREVSAATGLDRDTIHDWCDEKSPRYKKDFSDTIKKGKALSVSWWEQQGRLNLQNKEFSPVLWYMNMKNRFGWRDKKEIDHTTKGEKIESTIVLNDKFREILESEEDDNTTSKEEGSSQSVSR